MTKSSNKRVRIGIGCILVLSFFVLCLFGLFLLYIGAVASPLNNFKLGPSEAMTTFDNPSLDFAMDYPKSWLADTLPYGDHGDNTAKGLIGLPGVSVMIQVPSSSKGLALEEIRRQRLAERQESDKDLLIDNLSVVPTQIDGVPALISESIEKYQGPGTILDKIPGMSRAQHVMELYFQKNARTYIITFSTSEENYPQLKGIFQRMIQSIRFRS